MKHPAIVTVERREGWRSLAMLPTAAELQEFYAHQYYQSTPSTSYQASYGELDLRYKTLRCEALLSALQASGLRRGDECLDVGAGEGFLMDAAERSGFMVTGLDYSSFGVAKFFPRLKDQLFDGDLMQRLDGFAAAGRRFAACSAINVLEHVLDPSQVLSSLSKILAPRGLVAITVPNDYCGLQKLVLENQLIDYEFWLAPPQHLHYFNAENLPRFCARMGFRVVDGFSDFPIDLFLLHLGSNYVADPENGPAAHQARLKHDLMIAQQGLADYLEVYLALFRVGVGRNITVILQQVEDRS